MKKYTIKDDLGNKKIVYADNVVDALTFIDSDKIQFGKVSVFVPSKYDDDKTLTINWYSSGAVTVNEAKNFMNDLKKAIDYVEKHRVSDSCVKDSKFYVGISKYDYTEKQANNDARKFGLQLKIVGKSRDPHFEYDAYLIGPRSNILKMLRANGMEDFEEDIEDSIKDNRRI